MPTISIPGAWYLDALPSGEHAAIVPHLRQVHTHHGLINYPEGDQPLWIVITNQPTFRILGQAHASFRSLEWTGARWEDRPASCGVWALIYGRDGTPHIAKCEPPTGSQGWRYVAPNGQLVTGDATIAVRHGLNERTDLSLAQDGTIEVGQGHNGEGACVWAGGALRLLHAGSCFNIRAKWNWGADIVCISFYTVAPDGIEGWIYRMSMAELHALPLVPSVPVIPTFHFTHGVVVLPFKDPEGVSGAPAEIVVNQNAQSVARSYFVAEDSLLGPFRGERWGIYTERADPTPLMLEHPRSRLLVGHDDTTDWDVTALRLRPFDIPMLELYFPRVRGLETIPQSAVRWRRQAVRLLQQWSGDCAVDPQFYLMGNAPPWLYTEAEVLEGLTYLSEIVNLSPRIKLIVPFAFLRANGISAHPSLQLAWRALLRAADTAGRATLLSVPVTPPPPPPPPPVDHTELKGVNMDKKIVGLVGPGGFYARIDPDHKTIIHFDARTVGPHERFEAIKLDNDTRYALRAVEADVILSADNTVFGSQQVAAQFSVRTRPWSIGNYERWTIKRDPDSGLVLAFVRYTEQGAEAERKFAGGLLSVIAQ